ncbi:hypothetical protein TGARI_219470 [Toxoplasma gondii ARI]|uniref:Uncharacterized protein n=1 Tax=Toxoplasma gondii ARI TaxID=1074872 RepID=A0A139Y8W4_TOXGO|nr:hypothetical protein TGARI_219470 [Toxoplasma gondii ARI]
MSRARFAASSRVCLLRVREVFAERDSRKSFFTEETWISKGEFRGVAVPGLTAPVGGRFRQPILRAVRGADRSVFSLFLDAETLFDSRKLFQESSVNDSRFLPGNFRGTAPASASHIAVSSLEGSAADAAFLWRWRLSLPWENSSRAACLNGERVHSFLASCHTRRFAVFLR